MTKMREQNYFYLDASDGELVVHFHTGNTARTEVLRDKLDYLAFFSMAAKRLGLNRNNLVVMCSSSLDFPGDYTTDPELIGLCEWIRSGEAADEAAERDDA